MPSDILLRCIICPKTPRFSDVSHLLTHVSSKGHLSHYFKLQVRSHEEPDAVDRLADYNAWYEKYNLAGLLSDRLRAKDARKGRGHTSLGGADIKRERRASTAARRSSAPEAAMSTGNLTTIVTSSVPMPSQLVVDPRLSQCYPAISTGHNQTYPLPSLPMGPVPGTASFQVSGPMPHTFVQAPPAWPLASQPSQLPSLGRWKSEPSPEDDEDQTSPLAQRSGLRRSARRAKKLASRRNRRAVSPDPFVDDDASFEQEEEDEEDNAERVDEMTRLKGILWPGMDLFDAATEQMRRKRNQKKDASVLKQMEKASEGVEPTEMVFSPFGTLRRERFIDGNVDESDLLPGETPLPKTRPPRRKRPVPPPPSINVGLRGFDRQQGRRQDRIQGFSLLESPIDPQPTYNFGNYVSPDSSDYSLTYGNQAQRPSNGFAIFNDESKEYTISHPGDALEDTKNFGRDNSYPATFGGINHQTKDYLDSKHQPRTAFPPGKENVDPVLSQAGRVDMRTGSTSWGGQHYHAASPQFSSHYTYGSGCPPGYVPFGDHDAFGYPYNPLSYQGFSQSANGKDFAASNDLFLSPDRKGVKEEPGDVSPNQTVSDVDREDVSRLYLATVSG